MINIVLNRAMIEVQDWLMTQIEEEEFLSILLVLKRQFLFKLIVESTIMKEKAKRNISSQQTEREGD